MIGLGDRFLDRSGGMTHLESAVPEQIKQLLHHFFEVRRNFSGALAMEKHHIDIAEGIELAPAISTQSDQCQRFRRGFLVTDSGGGGENVSQQNIDKIGPARANFPATAASLMFQAQPMLFDLKKLLVKREDLRRAFFSRGGKLVLSVGQNLFQMSRRHDLILTAMSGDFHGTGVTTLWIG